jgi:hypothetical protein
LYGNDSLTNMNSQHTKNIHGKKTYEKHIYAHVLGT